MTTTLGSGCGLRHITTGIKTDRFGNIRCEYGRAITATIETVPKSTGNQNTLLYDQMAATDVRRDWLTLQVSTQIWNSPVRSAVDPTRTRNSIAGARVEKSDGLTLPLRAAEMYLIEAEAKADR